MNFSAVTNFRVTFYVRGSSLRGQYRLGTFTFLPVSEVLNNCSDSSSDHMNGVDSFIGGDIQRNDTHHSGMLFLLDSESGFDIQHPILPPRSTVTFLSNSPRKQPIESTSTQLQQQQQQQHRPTSQHNLNSNFLSYENGPQGSVVHEILLRDKDKTIVKKKIIVSSLQCNSSYELVFTLR